MSVTHEYAPKKLGAKPQVLETDIAWGLSELEGML